MSWSHIRSITITTKNYTISRVHDDIKVTTFTQRIDWIKVPHDEGKKQGKISFKTWRVWNIWIIMRTFKKKIWKVQSEPSSDDTCHNVETFMLNIFTYFQINMRSWICKKSTYTKLIWKIHVLRECLIQIRKIFLIRVQ